MPGVGLEKAGRLLDTFGSVEAVISASSSELQSVDGIGKSLADKIKWAVSEQMQPHGAVARHPIGRSDTMRTKQHTKWSF